MPAQICKAVVPLCTPDDESCGRDRSGIFWRQRRAPKVEHHPQRSHHTRETRRVFANRGSFVALHHSALVVETAFLFQREEPLDVAVVGLEQVVVVAPRLVNPLNRIAAGPRRNFIFVELQVGFHRLVVHGMVWVVCTVLRHGGWRRVDKAEHVGVRVATHVRRR